jgi:hypothetical protein
MSAIVLATNRIGVCEIVLQNNRTFSLFASFYSLFPNSFSRLVISSLKKAEGEAETVVNMNVTIFACANCTVRASQHLLAMNGLISLGSAKITSARSPIIPAPTMTGAFFSGPRPLASVIKRRLRSQNLRVCPLAVVTV